MVQLVLASGDTVRAKFCEEAARAYSSVVSINPAAVGPFTVQNDGSGILSVIPIALSGL